MPQFTRVSLNFTVLAGLMLWLTANTVQAQELGWMTREQMAKLPLEQQRMVPAWCGGRYYAPQFRPADPADDTEITADSLQSSDNGFAELIGNVRISQPSRYLHAETLTFNQDTGDYFLQGDVSVDAAEYSLKSERMSGNQNHDTARLYDVEFAFFANHSRGTARTAEQQQQLFHIQDASYTTCPPGKRTWSITAKDIHLDREKGWGTAKHTVFRVYDKPALYLPWITFPIDDRRKTGLLFPTVSYSDDNGLDFSQPIYINLHPQIDATIAPRTIQQRGEGVDSEFRYLTQFGEGKVSYGFLSEDRRFNNKNREIASWQHDGSYQRWSFSADVTNVSDDFYFKDLDTGLDVRSQTSLSRQLEARYRGKQWHFLSRVQSWQTIDPTLAERNKPYRRLPQLALTGKHELYGPLKSLWLSDFTRFERQTSGNIENITGDRLHFAPALALPLNTVWGFVEPRVRLYHTRYSLSGVRTLTSREPERTLVGTSIDSGLYFERNLNIGHQSLMQTLEPRLFYNYVPHKEQTDLPDFDTGELTFGYESLFRENRLTGYDRIGDENKLTLGVTSRFLNQDDGRELLRLRTAQAYYFSDREVQYEQRSADTSDLSPFIADMTWYLGRHWQLFSELQWDTEENKRTQNNVRLGYNDGKQRILHVGYRQRYEHNEDFQQAELAAMWPVHRHWSVIGRWMYDLENHRSIENIAGLEYRDCCVQLRLVTIRDLVDRKGRGQLESDRTIMFQIQLTGLGGLGGRLESLLERSITGYGRRHGTNY